MSPAEVEKKVNDYLRKSQLLAEQRQRPIAAEQLQAEMDRMASHTKQPAVLRELFAALGNDPFVIAECLAKPLMAERLVSESNVHDGIGAFVSNAGLLGEASAPKSQVYILPEISSPLDCVDNGWTATTPVNAPDARNDHTAVWTGSEMIIWGGYNSNGGHVNTLNTGGKYNPA